jgi:hypothetical protein
MGRGESLRASNRADHDRRGSRASDQLPGAIRKDKFPMENDGSSEVDSLKVVKWAWRHHVLGADFYDSIEDAVLASKSAEDYGDESLDCIEVIEGGVSRVLSSEEYHAIVDPIEEAEWAEIKARPKSVAVLDLAEPTGKHWSPHQGYSAMEDAQKAASDFRQQFGESRVRVRSTGR